MSPTQACTRHSFQPALRGAPVIQSRKVIPLASLRRNCNHIVQYDFRTSSIEDATNDKYGDSVGENYKGHHRGAAVPFTVPSRSHLYALKTMPKRHY